MEYLSRKMLPYGNILPNAGFFCTNVTEQEYLWLLKPYLSYLSSEAGSAQSPEAQR